MYVCGVYDYVGPYLNNWELFCPQYGGAILNWVGRLEVSYVNFTSNKAVGEYGVSQYQNMQPPPSALLLTTTGHVASLCPPLSVQPFFLHSLVELFTLEIHLLQFALWSMPTSWTTLLGYIYIHSTCTDALL